MIFHRKIFDEIENYFDSPEAVIVTGMRRTGKTTLLNYVYQKFKTDNKLFLDLENPLNRKLFEEENYEKIKSSFKFLGLTFEDRGFIFLDEIQFVKNLPSVVKYFIDHYKTKFFLTGSASFYLKNLFTESLSGRKAIFELFPLTFREFIIFKKSKFKIPKDASKLSRTDFDAISPLFDEYLFYGGFPEVVLKNNVKEKEKALEDIFTSFFQMEVLQFGDFRKNEVIRDLMLLLIQNIGSKLGIQNISRDLKISRPVLNNYIAFLEGSYFIKTIKPFSRGKSTEIRKTPKVYVCDSGIANRFARLDMGHIFENSVFQNLRIKGEVNYYQRKSGVEVDFILNRQTAYEVKVNPRRTDIRRIKELSAELNLQSYCVVSKEYSELENVNYIFNI